MTCIAFGAAKADTGQRFISIAFHDVVDKPDDLDLDAVTSDRLVAFFDFLKGDGWTAITLDDVARARSGEKPLPRKAILLSFDDGYSSLYTRVFPLLLAYRFPAVAALVGEWLDAPMDSTVIYSEQSVPRSNFISWDQAREMKASGLVEFASHSFAQHKAITSNPQGNVEPALSTARYDPGSASYETPEQFRERFRADLRRNSDLIEKEIGSRPRAMVWPFGRYTLDALEVLKAEKYDFALTLNDEPGDTTLPMQIGRYLPTENLPLSDLVTDLRFSDRFPATQRLLSLDPAEIWSSDPAEFERRLGIALERLITLGATGIVLQAVSVDPVTKQLASWFPTSQLPLRGDALNRIAWQLRTRAGVAPFVISAPDELSKVLSVDGLRQLYKDLGRMVPVDGLIFANTTLADVRAGHSSPAPTSPWAVRKLRRTVVLDALPSNDRIALVAFREVEIFRPALKLITLGPFRGEPPGDIVDMHLYQTEPSLQAVANLHQSLRQAGVFDQRSFRLRAALWLQSRQPLTAAQLSSMTRSFQIAGGTAIGWSADSMLADEPAASLAGPTVSSSSFPLRPR